MIVIVRATRGTSAVKLPVDRARRYCIFVHADAGRPHLHDLVGDGIRFVLERIVDIANLEFRVDPRSEVFITRIDERALDRSCGTLGLSADLRVRLAAQM